MLTEQPSKNVPDEFHFDVEKGD